MNLSYEDADLPPVVSTAPVPYQGDTSLAAIFSANRDAAEYDGISFAKRNAMRDATQNRIDAVTKATGTELENPYTPNTEALADYDDADQSTWQQRMDKFQSQLSELAEKHPDKTDIIGANRPIDEDAKALANAASQKASDVNTATYGLLPDIIAFAGGAAGSFRDPIMAGSLFVPGGGELEAASIANRIAVAGARQAAIMAASSAVSQPWVQTWRAERGQDYGVVPALKDIGTQALYGFVPGAGEEAAKIAGKALWPRISEAVVGRGLAGDGTAARQLVEALPKEAAPAAHAAIEADHLDQLARSEPLPEGVTQQAIQPAYNQAIRHVEDQTQPLPKFVYPSTPEGEATATAAIQNARTPVQAVDALREDPRALAAALGSSDPDLESLGHVANLGDEAYAMVRSGDASPEVAAEVGSRVSDHADQAAILRRVSELNPRDAQQAARLVSQEMDHLNMAQAQHIALGAEGEPARMLSAPDDDMGEISGRSAQLAQLEQELAPHVRVELHEQAVPPPGIAEHESVAGGEAGVERSHAFSQDLTSHAERLMKMGGHADMARALEEAAIQRVPEDIRHAVDASATSEGRGVAAAEGGRSVERSAAEAGSPGSGERLRRPGEVGRPEAWAAERAEQPRPNELGPEPGSASIQPTPETGDVRQYLDTVPASSRIDGSDMAPMTREDMIAREPREGFLASIIEGCPVG